MKNKAPFIGCTTGVDPQIQIFFKIEPDEYKEKCPRCGGPAYISFNLVDCKERCH